MSARKLSLKPHTLWWAFPSGTTRSFECASEREARTRIAYCLADNVGMSRREAARHADAVPADGTRYTEAPFFVFTLEPTP